MPRPWPPTPSVYGATPSLVILDFVRSKITRADRLEFDVLSNLASKLASHVLLSSVPAFWYWDLKPAKAGSGTDRIWSVVVVVA